ncbi:MAG TPA: hypothetical protein VLE19_00095 [Pyrinomonadaceae bacterium]|nr:hypothetical protein [Pyrinomonadaceae bacterium]
MSLAEQYVPSAKSPLSRSTGPDDEAEIRRIENEWGDAFLKRDMAALNRIIDDEYMLTDPLG